MDASWWFYACASRATSVLRICGSGAQGLAYLVLSHRTYASRRTTQFGSTQVPGTSPLFRCARSVWSQDTGRTTGTGVGPLTGVHC
ncbi:hypothetical protein BO94DRAFT_47180 [Aspergillus sclerotioniger CBS 115572]|uniref:Uncharacterized protein n=1 Tax=Aspergillus sclerotioniger CBS 115572 TaxID=1450535 RepID=A0A317WQI4_9EURO|nr:hypothetical protein BO94DRAFT_47180 [Aspergillus sclerotioniger CBS 115572]PWY88666.1 hypothetical protein BO94DRAFT_47180 [Aspergillus sclerotioniger CBS 115572]